MNSCVFEKNRKKILASMEDNSVLLAFSHQLNESKYDKETKDTEIVKYEENIDDYMAREVLPHIPDAKAFFEENLTAKKPVIKIGAEIPFTRYFYKYTEQAASEQLAKEFQSLEESVRSKINELF